MEKKSFFGWPLAIVLGLMYFMSSGFVLATAQIVNPMMLQDPSMGLTGTVLGAGFSLFVLMQGLPSPIVGQLVAKKGAKFTMALGGAIMLVGVPMLILPGPGLLAIGGGAVVATRGIKKVLGK